MSLSRRDFLRRTTLAVAGGLIVGDAAMELFERLSHRKVFALGAIPTTIHWPYPPPQPMTVYVQYVAHLPRQGERVEWREVVNFSDNQRYEWPRTPDGYNPIAWKIIAGNIPIAQARAL